MGHRYWLAITVAVQGLNLTFASGADAKRCLGMFCGRITPLVTSNSSSTSALPCGPCPWGYRTDGFICQKCNLEPSFYDWLFLGFMALLAPFLNSHLIEYVHKVDRKTLILHVSVFFEFCIGCLLAVIIMEPFGKISLAFCGVHSMKDWYTIFCNPKPNFDRTIRCTQEAVYPLFSIVLLFYALELLLLIIIRVPVYGYILIGRKVQRKSIYATLYVLPSLAVIHTIFSGVLYYTFPYILLIVSSLGTAVYLSIHSAEIWTKLKEWQTIFILLMYALAHAYGIVSITQLKIVYRDGPLLFIIFLPSSFYLLTHKLTAPAKFCRY